MSPPSGISSIRGASTVAALVVGFAILFGLLMITVTAPIAASIRAAPVTRGLGGFLDIPTAALLNLTRLGNVVHLPSTTICTTQPAAAAATIPPSTVTLEPFHPTPGPQSTRPRPVHRRRWQLNLDTHDASLVRAAVNHAPDLKTSAGEAVAIKSDTKCNVLGRATWILEDRYVAGLYAADILICQSACLANSSCLSYSYRDGTPDDENCIFYSGLVDYRNSFVIKDPLSNTRFSAKFPQDGSDFCYGDHQL